MTEDESYGMISVRGVINNSFGELLRIDRINNHERIVKRFVKGAVRVLFAEYWDYDSYKRLTDYLNIKYDERWGLSTVEWVKYTDKWKDIGKDVIDEVPYEKRRQWMDKIESFQETDLIKKIKVSFVVTLEHPLHIEFEKMFLVLFYEIKQYLRPLISKLDFSWCEKSVNEIIGNI